MQERVIEMLRTVYDPEIPVNVYDLGLIYRIELNDDCTELAVDMTLTAPNCRAAETGNHKRTDACGCESGVRTRVGQGHDERGSQVGVGIYVSDFK